MRVICFIVLSAAALIRRQKADADAELVVTAETAEVQVAAEGEEKGWFEDMVGGGQKEVTCCCKEGPCRTKDEWPVGVTGLAAVYHPGESGAQTCCKLRFGCSTWRGYTQEKPDFEMCTEPDDPLGDLPVWGLPKRSVNVDELEPKSAQHTLHEYCDKTQSAEGSDEENDLLNSLVHEFEENSLTTMAQEMFSLYSCVRWAPDKAFRAMAYDEFTHGSLPKNSDTAGANLEHLSARAVERGQFIPLRCSENIGVYEVEANKQFYPAFERRIGAMSTYFEAQQDSVFAARSRVIEDSEPAARLIEHFTSSDSKRDRWNDLLKNADLFDLEMLDRAAPTGPCDDPHIRVDIASASPEDLLKDCAFVQRFRGELRDFESRFPFRSFLSSDKESYLQAGERVLICFGKRVAGDLHRRNEGKHILADTNAVGCHGFWKFEEAAQMLTQMKDLWAPPTCQLTELELEMKVKMLEMFVTMNERLFDSLPSMMAGNGLDPSQTIDTHEATGVTKVAAVTSWITDRMSLHRSRYAELGSLLADSKFKWSVCPVKSGSNEKALDQALGVEDVVVSHVIKDAYKKWTGNGNKLPGQDCEAFRGFADDRYLTCKVSTMRKDYKEPYHDVEFACPELPLLPPQVQLGVVRTKEASGEAACLLRARPEDLLHEPWPSAAHATPGHFPGDHPTLTQYEPRAHPPAVTHEVVRVLKVRSSLDVSGISRYYGDVGRLCTAEFRQRFPRWCTASALYPKYTDLIDGALDTLDTLAGGAISAGTGIAELTGLKEKGEKTPEVTFGAKAGAFASNTGSWVAGLVRDGIGAMAGRSKRRYDAIRAERFETVEAGELVHESSYQKVASEGVTYDRYLVTTECSEWDPEEETASEFAWGEAALELLEKALKTAGGNAAASPVTNGPQVLLAARGEAQLVKAEDGTPRVHSRVHWKWGAEQWTVTRAHLPYVNDMVAKTRDGFEVPNKLKGMQVELVCGARKEVYEAHYRGSGSFAQCVAAAQAAQANLAEAADTSFEDEVVVRAVFTPLERCQCSPSNVQDAIPVMQKELDNLASSCGACEKIARVVSKYDSGDVVASWAGAGTPASMRKEVILPIDVVSPLFG